jgi:hypothetical protein
MIKIPIHKCMAGIKHCLSCDDVIKPSPLRHLGGSYCFHCSRGQYESKYGDEKRKERAIVESAIRDAVTAVLGEYD